MAAIKGKKWIAVAEITVKKGGEIMNLNGYPTRSGWFGEIRKGIWRFFPTEDEWLEYVTENSDD